MVNVRGNNLQADIPGTSHTVERAAILNALSSFQSYRVILVTAPPGYGKTTAVAQFVTHYRIPTAWQTIEDRDRDLPNLQRHSLQSLRSIAPGIDHLFEPELTSHECAARISSYLKDHLAQHSLYVLDDLQLLVNSPHTEVWLQSLVTLLPPKCHLALISRTVPDLPLAELIAKRAIIAIGQSQLRFSDEEALLLAKKMGSEITAEQTRQRVRQLEGWPAGLAVALQPLPDEVELRLFNGQQGPEALFAKLAEMMLQKQSPVLRNFLLSVSVLSHVTPEKCSKILDLKNSEDLPAMLVERGLFVTRVAGGFVFHRLFRGFLQTQLRQLFPDRFLQLHLRAGDWFWSQGELDTAFEHYLTAGAVEKACQIVERAHMAYFSQGKVETLLLWRSMLGDDAVRTPYLIYKCAIIFTDRYRYAEAEAELQLVENLFTAANDVTGLADVRLQRIIILLRRGKYRQVIEQVTPLLENPSLPERITARAKQCLAVSYRAMGDTQQSVRLLEEVLPVYENNQDLYALSTVLQDMEVAYTLQGDLENASRCLQQVVWLRRQLRRPEALALALNNLGYHYHQRRNYREAVSNLEEGLKIIGQTVNRRVESYLLWSLGDVRRDLGEFKLALQLYNQAYELSSEMEPSLQKSILLSMSTLYRWQRDFLLAEQLARQAAGSDDTTPDSVIAHAKIWMAYAHRMDALYAFHQLTALCDALKSQKSRLEYKLCALFCAEAALFSNQPALVDPYLAECLSTKPEVQQACPSEIVAEILHEPTLKAYIATKPRYRMIHEIIAQLQMESLHQQARKRASHPAPHPTHTYSLRVHTLGIESIERNGEIVPASAWRAHRAQEFFLYLLLHGAQTRETLSLVFWPNSSPKRVRSNFHTTLYRMRQALGENVIAFENGRYGINPEIEVFCDALVMTVLVEEARLLLPSDVRAEDLYYRAIQLYQGDFLPSLDTGWADSWRYKLQELYIEAFVGSGRCAYARHSYKEAITHYQRALEFDPYREEVYRAIFLCYAELGELYLLISQFREMERLFRTELGVSPSAETTDLLRRLI
jgi:LuxR family transcriptional regulator, maltose regulon positive regulatory protein